VLFLKKPTARIADLYSLLLEVQLSSIQRVQPGVTFNELQQQAQRQMAEGLKALTVFDGSVDKILEQDLPRCYMHSLGHHLGLDVHDGEGLALKDKPFEAGMVITIEPGFYFVPAYFHDHPLAGLGFRIEDDVLVTSKSNRVLSSAPKELAEILDGC